MTNLMAAGRGVVCVDGRMSRMRGGKDYIEGGGQDNKHNMYDIYTLNRWH